MLHFPNPPTVFQHETDTFFLQLQRLADLATAGGAGDFKPYTGQPLSKFVGSDPSGERRAVFVNESACIGCRQCNHSAPKTFMMEDDWGRARAFAQWDDSEEDINIAIGANGRLAEPLEAAIPMDYYALLQLDFDATAKDVKSQYRQLQKWCHPDIAGAAGTEVSIILNEAYDTLMDENERAVYDRDLRELQVRVAFPKSADCFPTRD